MNSIDIANCLNQIFCILSDNMDYIIRDLHVNTTYNRNHVYINSNQINKQME